MLLKRIIPTLLLTKGTLVKTTRFRKPKYIGDPVNTVRIFNELEVDELLILDIGATRYNLGPNFKILKEIASECFMPLAYGGGINSIEHAKILFSLGFEKIVLNVALIRTPNLISEISRCFGSQAVIASIDFKRLFFNRRKVFILNGKSKTNYEPVDLALKVESLGAGEILMTSIDKEGTWVGYDYDLIKEVSSKVSIPVIAHGGAGTTYDVKRILENTEATAAAVGSMFVFQKKGNGVLVNFPEELRKFNSHLLNCF
jgi:cyclase